MPNPSNELLENELLEIDLDMPVDSNTVFDDFGIDLSVIVGSDFRSEEARILSQILEDDYSHCPFCGETVDLSQVDLVEKGKYLYCSCFENSPDWQYRMQARNSPYPLQVMGTYTLPSAKETIALVIILEDVSYTHQVWRTYLRVNPSALLDDEPLVTLEALWPPEKETADLLLLLSKHQRFLDEIASRLRENTYCVSPANVREIEKIIELLETNLKKLERN